MGKRKILIVLLSCIVVFLFGCKQNENHSLKEEIQKQICEECFNEDTQVGRTIKDVVDIDVEIIDENNILLKIKAPNISEELLFWMEQIGDEQFNEQRFEEEVIRLLCECERDEFFLELQYAKTSNLNIYYTEEYINVVSCGLEEFYDLMMQRAIEDIRGK